MDWYGSRKGNAVAFVVMGLFCILAVGGLWWHTSARIGSMQEESARGKYSTRDALENSRKDLEKLQREIHSLSMELQRKDKAWNKSLTEANRTLEASLGDRLARMENQDQETQKALEKLQGQVASRMEELVQTLNVRMEGVRKDLEAHGEDRFQEMFRQGQKKSGVLEKELNRLREDFGKKTEALELQTAKTGEGVVKIREDLLQLLEGVQGSLEEQLRSVLDEEGQKMALLAQEMNQIGQELERNLGVAEEGFARDMAACRHDFDEEIQTLVAQMEAQKRELLTFCQEALQKSAGENKAQRLALQDSLEELQGQLTEMGTRLQESHASLDARIERSFEEVLQLGDLRTEDFRKELVTTLDARMQQGFEKEKDQMKTLQERVEELKKMVLQSDERYKKVLLTFAAKVDDTEEKMLDFCRVRVAEVAQEQTKTLKQLQSRVAELGQKRSQEEPPAGGVHTDVMAQVMEMEEKIFQVYDGRMEEFREKMDAAFQDQSAQWEKTLEQKNKDFLREKAAMEAQLDREREEYEARLKGLEEKIHHISDVEEKPQEEKPLPSEETPEEKILPSGSGESEDLPE